MINEINVGIVGAGFMGKAHTYGYRTIPLYYDNLPFKIRLVGICDALIDVARKAKDTLGFEFATDRPGDIFSRDDINVVDVCTPNVFHKDAVVAAIKAGKNVYCDKPLATTYADAKEIVSLLAKHKVVAQMALQYRFFPATLRAKQILTEGRIGRILSFRACYLHSGSVDPKRPMGWKQDKSIGGGGVLFDLGAHALDLMYCLLGEYESVFAQTGIAYPERPDKAGRLVKVEADDVAYVLVRMKSGCTGAIEVSKLATGANDELRFEIHGDKGSLRFNSMDENWLEFYDNTAQDAPIGGVKGYTKIECVHRYEKPGGGFPGPKFPTGWLRAHVHSHYCFLSCVHAGKPASPSLEDGAYIQHVMEQAYASDATGKRLQIA